MKDALSLDQLRRGKPPVTGRYLVYVEDVRVARDVFTWLGGEERWLDRLDKPYPYRGVTAWFGPLPTLPPVWNRLVDEQKQATPEPEFWEDQFRAKPVVEYDL